MSSHRTEIKLDRVSASFAGATARASGIVRLAREPSAELRFELAAENLRRLQQGLPELPLSMSGNYAGSRDKLEVKNLKGRIGETEISGWVSMVGTGRKRVEAELRLTPPGSDTVPSPEDRSEIGRRRTFKTEAAAEKSEAQVRLR